MELVNLSVLTSRVKVGDDGSINHRTPPILLSEFAKHGHIELRGGVFYLRRHNGERNLGEFGKKMFILGPPGVMTEDTFSKVELDLTRLGVIGLQTDLLIAPKSNDLYNEEAFYDRTFDRYELGRMRPQHHAEREGVMDVPTDNPFMYVGPVDPPEQEATTLVPLSRKVESEFERLKIGSPTESGVPWPADPPFGGDEDTTVERKVEDGSGDWLSVGTPDDDPIDKGHVAYEPPRPRDEPVVVSMPHAPVRSERGAESDGSDWLSPGTPEDVQSTSDTVSTSHVPIESARHAVAVPEPDIIMPIDIEYCTDDHAIADAPYSETATVRFQILRSGALEREVTVLQYPYQYLVGPEALVNHTVFKVMTEPVYTFSRIRALSHKAQLSRRKWDDAQHFMLRCEYTVKHGAIPPISMELDGENYDQLSALKRCTDLVAVDKREEFLRCLPAFIEFIRADGMTYRDYEPPRMPDQGGQSGATKIAVAAALERAAAVEPRSSRLPSGRGGRGGRSNGRGNGRGRRRV